MDEWFWTIGLGPALARLQGTGPSGSAPPVVADEIPTKIGFRTVGPLGQALTDPGPTAPGLRNVIEATFAPDGQQIAYTFSRPGPSPVRGIGVVRADGTDAHDILSGKLPSSPADRVAGTRAPALGPDVGHPGPAAHHGGAA